MNALRFSVSQVARDFKSGELSVMTLALVVAVAALTAIGFFTNRVARAVESQAGAVLAADLRFQSPQPLADKYIEAAKQNGLSSARAVSFPSVVLLGERSALAAVHGVSAEYPLRGHVKVSDVLGGVAKEIVAAPRVGEVWADGRLLAQLQADVGSMLSIGRAELKVSRVLVARPDQGTGFSDLAPSLLFNIEDLARTELIQPGSRASYALLFAGPLNAVNEFRVWLRANKQPSERLRSIADASEQVSNAIDRAGRFLNLASMVSVLLSAIAVAMAARRYASRRMDLIALLKSMGATQARVMQMQLIALLMLALIATVVGTAIGYAAQQGLAWLLADLVRGELPAPSFAPALLGLVTSIAVLGGFALPPLLQLKRVPPVRVLRKDVEPPPLRYLTVYGAALIAVVAIVWWIVRDARLVQYVTLGALFTCVVLYGCGWLLVKILSRFRGAVGVSWRYGIANIARRGRESIAQIVAFGLGLMVLLLLAVVHNDLLDEWRTSLPADAPNQFLINIRADQTDAVREFFAAQEIVVPTLVPMVRARLVSINDVPVSELRAQRRQRQTSGVASDVDEDRARGFMEREANLTWSAEFPAGNKLTSGQWWKEGDGGGPRASMDQGIATALRVKLGDRVTYDVGGEQVEATIANFREVQWDSFRPNFFIVFSPGVLDSAAGTYITSVHLPAEKSGAMLEFTRRFPEITAIDIDAVISQVRDVMDKVTIAVQYVFLFTLFAGVTVLFAAIQATKDERRYESAMLRTLGASRRVVLQGVAAEFSVLGLLAGVMAASGASVAGYFLATQVLSLDYSFDATVWGVGLLAGVTLVGVIGTAATYSVVNAPPVETLRRGG
ncbi:MAG: ABC transporter permease [Candidatus Obscuribacterales bacterium]|nr:ABC transporter permease [Steroidobacteraceae bacterium]